MHRAGADLHVERLLQRAAARRPELGQLEDEILESHERRPSENISRSTRTDFKSFSRCMVISARCAASSSRSAPAGTGESPSANGLDERAAEAAPALARVLRNAALLAAVPRQKHHNPVRLTELVGPENQCVGGVKRHREAGYNCTIGTPDCGPAAFAPSALRRGRAVARTIIGRA